MPIPYGNTRISLVEKDGGRGEDRTYMWAACGMIKLVLTIVTRTLNLGDLCEFSWQGGVARG